MRPRIFPTAQAELEQINVALRRAYEPPPPTRQNSRALAQTIRDLGALASTIAIAIVPVVALMLAWSKPADPMGDAKLNNAPKNQLIRHEGAVEPVVKQLVVGDIVEFKEDFPGLKAIVQESVHMWEELPWTGNKIGDARYVFASKHWFVWLKPSTALTPTWIDP